MKKDKWIKFKEAREFVRSLKLPNYRAWKTYCKSGFKPPNIPGHPNDNKEWIDVYDWLGTNRDRRKYKVNDGFFSKWSHDMAYILGFWFADGSICIKPKGKRGSKYTFAISQNTKDKYILMDISKKMKSTFPIYDGINGNGSSYSKLTINSEFLVLDILKLGGKERKSLDVKFPKIPKKYLADFTR